MLCATSTTTFDVPTSTTLPRTARPRPSPIMIISRGRIRRTTAACRPSSPPSTTWAPTLGSGSGRSSEEERVRHGRRLASLAGERVPQPPEDAAAVLLNGDLGPGLVAELGQLAQQIPLLVIDPRRSLDEQCDAELPSPASPQPRDAFAVDRRSGCRTGSRMAR